MSFKTYNFFDIKENDGYFSDNFLFIDPSNNDIKERYFNYKSNANLNYSSKIMDQFYNPNPLISSNFKNISTQSFFNDPALKNQPIESSNKEQDIIIPEIPEKIDSNKDFTHIASLLIILFFVIFNWP